MREKQGMKIEYILYFLILFPFLSAVLLAFVKGTARKIVTFSSSALIIGAAVSFTAIWAARGSTTLSLLQDTHIIDYIMIAGEIFLMALVCVLSVKWKKYYAGLLSVVQTVAIIWFELSGSKSIKGFEPAAQYHIYIDFLSVVMILIIAVVGTLITVFAVGYMKDYHNKLHTQFKDRTKFFFAMMYTFIGAMFGLVMSSNLNWMYFFWEITSVVSFLMIGYSRTPKAIDNCFRALWMNLLGGCGFCAAILWLGFKFSISDLQALIASKSSAALVPPILLLAFAALTKSAQLPFSRWLLGAMVAPTPSSALLHSATMVKAGVYLLLRLAPQLNGNYAGYMVALIGGFTFLITSMLAITVTDGKKLLAYSTISNLGLITACSGVGSSETVWAGISLMIFHAVSKSLLFQTVGAIENTTGSRDIEKMHGLIIRQPKLALTLVIGIAGMFLAPFGMLVSKWAALKSFIDTDNKTVGIILVIFICFGSATTLFYWAKWLLKAIAVIPKESREPDCSGRSEWFSLYTHAALMLILCFAFPFVSKYVISPYVERIFNIANPLLSDGNMIIMIFMVIMVFVVPTLVGIFNSKISYDKSTVYINGVGKKDMYFTDSMGEDKRMYLAGWYLDDIFSKKKLWNLSLIISATLIVVYTVLAIGGAL